MARFSEGKSVYCIEKPGHVKAGKSFLYFFLKNVLTRYIMDMYRRCVANHPNGVQNMYIDVVPNHGSEKKTTLIRESYWEDGKCKKRTVANVTKLSKDVISKLKVLLKNKKAIVLPNSLSQISEVTRTLNHGHVLAIKGFMKNIGIPKLIGHPSSKHHSTVLAMIASRIIDPQSKILTYEGWKCDQKDLENDPEDRDHSLPKSTLGLEYGLSNCGKDDLYQAMDWLLEKQDEIEKKLAAKHLSEGALILYDLTSVYMEGKTCPLAHRGYSRDKKQGKLQIEFGLLTDREGCPVAVEVFEGHTADPATVASQIDKLRHKFGLKKLIFVGDRGMVTETNILRDLAPVGVDWITALRRPSLEKLMRDSSHGVQTSLFDTKSLVEVKSDEYPGKRLVICHNPFRERANRWSREEKLDKAEERLFLAQVATQRKKSPLRGRENIQKRVDQILSKLGVTKYFHIEIRARSLMYSRNEKAIREDKNLDGLYVIVTNLKKEEMTPEKVVASYKCLTKVERAFRSLKSVTIKVRPIHHRLEKRVRSHIFLCVLSYYVEWHMRQALKPLLFDDEEPQELGPRSQTQKSPSAQKKAAIRKNSDGFPVQTFSSLIEDLSQLSKCWLKFVSHDDLITHVARPTPLQREVFRKLEIKLT